MRGIRFAFLAVAMTVAVGCSHTGSKMSESASLYDRLGGKDAITAVVLAFVDRFESDDRVTNKVVANRLAQIDGARLRSLLVDMVCEGAGGPCKYTGRDMSSAHAGLNITNAEFDVAVDDLIITLKEFKVPEREKEELLDMLGPLRKDVVQAP
ncbi:MAG: group 1 truncated hemoglobin [Leptospirillia bacterium]